MKNAEQPHKPRIGWLKNGNPPCDLSKLPRCTAKSKHSGKRCKQPAMANGKCHWHGGKSTGAPRGNFNALKHGLYTREAIEKRKALRDLIKQCKDVLAEVNNLC